MARRQEQEDAQTEISEIAPNVLRTQLPIRLPGLGHVNMYALLDDDGAAVIDPGLPGPRTWRAIKDRLKQAGLKVSDIHTVFVTHSHPDHFGGASRFAKECGAKVVGHEKFVFGPVQAVENDSDVSVDDLADDLDEQRVPAVDQGLREDEARAAAHKGRSPWGGERERPSLRRQLHWKFNRLMSRVPFVPKITHAVKHGDVLRLAGREWFVVHTPGHTEDHICLHDPEEGLFVAGDHVLPTITPHISGVAGNRDPLAAFFDSLDLAGATPDVKQVLPAHGHPFADLAERCEAIKMHHAERLDVLKAIGRELGTATVQAYSKKLFKPRSWGMMAESETFAHLEHLRLGRDAERWTDKEGRFVYQTG